ncbi:hypothetical protein N9V96_01610 [Polaribacter sp.]|nr:hypothetical protein [Polaribacter sp.]
MKNFKLFIIPLTISLLFFSHCSKDEGSTIGEDEALALEQNASEDLKITLATLSSGVTINGSTKETGIAPAPNSDLDFQLNTSATEAFQSSGFSVEFSSSDNIAGAYILLKDIDGNTADSYFDVTQLYAKNVNKKGTTKSVLGKTKTNVQAKNDYENEIAIDFGDNVPAGQFCYDICLYDYSNNISQIQTVCVTVEFWGGNAAIVGEWVFDKTVPDFTEETEEIQCDNNQTFEAVYYLEENEKISITFFEDGSYLDKYYSEDKYFRLYRITVKLLCRLWRYRNL